MALVAALFARGHDVELMEVPAWIGHEPDHLTRSMLASRLLDIDLLCGYPVDRVIALKFPAWLVRHERKTLWVLHQFRQAYDLYHQGLSLSPDGSLTRDLVRQADQLAFDEARSVLAISSNVASRLERSCGIDAPVYRPPPPDGDLMFSSGSWESYFLFPSRLAPLKRHELVLEAVAACRSSVRLLVAGAPERAGNLERLQRSAERLGVDQQVEWLGWCSASRLRALYSEARAVIFPPVDEDYGFVTAEAMLSGRPVITCTDSGGPVELVRDQINGLIVPPEAEALAAGMELLWADAALARRWGEAGTSFYQSLDITWDRVAEGVLA